MSGGFDPETPVSEADEFYGRLPLSYAINASLGNETSVVLIGHRKSGKTSLINILPQLVQDGFIPVRLKLDVTGTKPSFSLVELFFTGAFKGLLQSEKIDRSDPYFSTWYRQTNRGDLSVDPELELIASGSRIALFATNENSPISINEELLEDDWRRLHEFAQSLDSNFRNFVFLLDNPRELMNVDAETRNMFRKLVGTPHSPLVIATTDIPTDAQTDSELFGFLVKAFVQEPQVFPLPTFTSSDIVNLIERVHPEVDKDLVLKTARNVQRITLEPYLVKSLLEIAEKRQNKSGEFSVSAEDCLELVRTKRSDLSPRDIEKLGLLHRLRAENEALFLAAATTLLAVSSSQSNLRVSSKRGRSSKAVEQIVLSLQAPNFPEPEEVRLRQENFLASLRRLWNYNLFFIVDSDGQQRTSADVGPDALSLVSQVSAETNPLILSYLRMSARDIDPDFKSPGAQEYFRYTCLRFARDIVSSLTAPEGTEGKVRNYIAAFDFVGNNRMTKNVRPLSQAIDDLDVDLFVNYFMHARHNLGFEQFLSGVEASNQYLALTLTFTNCVLPEHYQFSFLIRTTDKTTLQVLQKTLEAWALEKGPLLQGTYKIELASQEFIEVPDQLIRSLSTASAGVKDIERLMKLFENGDFESLHPDVALTLEKHLEFVRSLPDDSTHLASFQRDGALPFSFMAAACGHFQIALEGLDFVMKSDLSRTLMAEDNKLVSLAASGDLIKAVGISNGLLKLLRTRMPDLREYFKLIFIPWDTTKERVGAYAIYLDSPTLFVYELQHASLLLLSATEKESSDGAASFLKEFENRLTKDEVLQLIETQFPAYRLLAFYLTQVGRVDEARSVLTGANPGEKSVARVQYEVAQLDLKALETGA